MVGVVVVVECITLVIYLFYSPVRFHVLPHADSHDKHVINTTEACSRQLEECVSAQTPQTFTTCCNTNEAPGTEMLKADGETRNI